MTTFAPITLFGVPLAELNDPVQTRMALSQCAETGEGANPAELTALIENIGAEIPDLLGSLREAGLKYIQSGEMDALKWLLLDTDKKQWPQIRARLQTTVTHSHFKRFAVSVSKRVAAKPLDKAPLDWEMVKGNDLAAARLALGRLVLQDILSGLAGDDLARPYRYFTERNFKIAPLVQKALAQWELRSDPDHDPLTKGMDGDDWSASLFATVYFLYFALLMTEWNIEIEIPKGLRISDPEQEKILHNALTELLKNAFKYRDETKERRFVKIKWNPEEQTLTFSDNGIGIKDTEAVWKGAREQVGYAEGSGVGLAYHREKLEAEGWKISVVSTPDVGATFTLTPPPGAIQYKESYLEDRLQKQRKHFQTEGRFDLSVLIPQVAARMTDDEKLALAKQLFWEMRQISLDFYEAAKRLPENDAAGLEKRIKELHQALNRLGGLFPIFEDEKLRRLSTLLRTSSLTLPINIRGTVRIWQFKEKKETWQELMTQINPDSFIVERVLFGTNIYRVNSLQKELFDIIQAWLQGYGDLMEQSLDGKIWAPKFLKKERSSDFFRWPPDPEGDIALKTYLELLGWTMTVETTGEQIVVRIDFGQNSIQ